jgi:hypothetical protein
MHLFIVHSIWLKIKMFTETALKWHYAHPQVNGRWTGKNLKKTWHFVLIGSILHIYKKKLSIIHIANGNVYKYPWECIGNVQF